MPRSSNDVPIISSCLSTVTTERLCFPVDKEVSMARRRKKTISDRIFENGDKVDTDIPDVPVLELAKCFELSHPKTLRARRVAEKSWPRGNKASELANHLSERVGRHASIIG